MRVLVGCEGHVTSLDVNAKVQRRTVSMWEQWIASYNLSHAASWPQNVAFKEGNINTAQLNQRFDKVVSTFCVGFKCIMHQ